MGFCWLGVLALVLVVRKTTTGPQAGVCAPISFAQTGFGVSFPPTHPLPLRQLRSMLLKSIIFFRLATDSALGYLGVESHLSSTHEVRRLGVR